MPEEIIPEVPVDRGDNLEPVVAELVAEVKDPVIEAAADDLTSKLDEEAEDKDPKKKDSRIPLARHEAVLNKEREKRADLERQLAQYQKGGQVADFNTEITAAENAVIKMDDEYQALLVNGELEKAAALMAKIRTTERQMTEAKSDMKIHAAEIRATETARYNTALERIESAFPTLNPDHAEYDADTMAEVADLKDAYQIKGLTPTAALQKAVKLLVEPRTTKQTAATEVKPHVDDKDVAAERKAAAVDKVVKATGKTPPSLAKVGLDGDKLGGGALSAESVMKMSQKEFAALNDETLARMRGDIL